MNEKDCQEIFARLSEYLDGELPAEDCEKLERHIRGCGPCVEFVESLRKSVELGRQYRGVEATPDLAPESEQILRDAYRRMRAARLLQNATQPQEPDQA